MPASINDLATQATNGTRPSPTTLTATHTVGGTTLTCAALTGWPTASAVHFITYTIDTSGNKVAGTQVDWKGVVSGTTITLCAVKAGTDQNYSIGAIVECAPTAGYANDVYSVVTKDHDTQGRHAQLTDTNGVKIVGLSPTASAVNDVIISNSATLTAPNIAVEGSDSNIDLKLSPKGTGLLQAYSWNGWQPFIATPVYVSATTMTVGVADYAIVEVGDKLWLNQSGTKYFYVIGKSGGNTLTIFAGTDYTLANAAITAPYFSKVATPVGFPHWFNYTPAYTGFSANPTYVSSRFSIVSRQCTVSLIVNTAGTSNATGFTITGPIAASSTATTSGFIGWAADNSAATQAVYQTALGSTTITLGKGNAPTAATWTASGSKHVSGYMIYEI